jgi:hypothetical protein
MATKTTVPLLLAVGAAALLLTGKKKPKKPATITPNGEGVFDRLVINSECSEILNELTLNKGDWDMWHTNRYYELVDGGMSDVDDITLQLLKEQSSHCPWDSVDKWTPLMKGLYDMLHVSVNGWHHTKGGPLEDEATEA